MSDIFSYSWQKEKELSDNIFSMKIIDSESLFIRSNIEWYHDYWTYSFPANMEHQRLLNIIQEMGNVYFITHIHTYHIHNTQTKKFLQFFLLLW